MNRFLDIEGHFNHNVFDQSPNKLSLRSWVHNEINDRAKIAQEIQDATENGKVALVWSSTDCDGTTGTGSAHIPVPTSLYKIYMQECGYGQHNEGPSAKWYKKPSQNPEYRDTHYIR